jgi:hypothetical protein
MSLPELIPAKKRKRQQPLLDFTQSIILTSTDYSKGLQEILAKKEATAAAALKRKEEKEATKEQRKTQKEQQQKEKEDRAKARAENKKRKELEAQARRGVPAARARRGQGNSADAGAIVQGADTGVAVAALPGGVEGWGVEGWAAAAAGAAETVWTQGWRQGEAGYYAAPDQQILPPCSELRPLPDLHQFGHLCRTHPSHLRVSQTHLQAQWIRGACSASTSATIPQVFLTPSIHHILAQWKRQQRATMLEHPEALADLKVKVKGKVVTAAAKGKAATSAVEGRLSTFTPLS